MIVVADASVLVAELLRRRGRELLAHPALRVVVAQEQWDETGHELERRLAAAQQSAVVRRLGKGPCRSVVCLAVRSSRAPTHR